VPPCEAVKDGYRVGSYGSGSARIRGWSDGLARTSPPREDVVWVWSSRTPPVVWRVNATRGESDGARGELALSLG